MQSIIQVKMGDQLIDLKEVGRIDGEPVYIVQQESDYAVATQVFSGLST